MVSTSSISLLLLPLMQLSITIAFPILIRNDIITDCVPRNNTDGWAPYAPCRAALLAQMTEHPHATVVSNKPVILGQGADACTITYTGPAIRVDMFYPTVMEKMEQCQRAHHRDGPGSGLELVAGRWAAAEGLAAIAGNRTMVLGGGRRDGHSR